MIFLTKDIQKITGIDRGRLEQWLARRYVIPSIREAQSSGTHHVWSRVDVYNVALFKHVVDSGLSRNAANKFLASGVIPQDASIDEIGFVMFAREGDRVATRVITYKEDDPLELDLSRMLKDVDMFKKDRQLDNLFLVNFTKIRREVDAKIEEITSERKQ